jgi:hypothetical protein
MVHGPRVAPLGALAVPDALQHRHVGAGAETPPGAGHDDGSDIGVGHSFVQAVVIGDTHFPRPGIEPFGAIERYDGHPVLDLVEHDIRFHRTYLLFRLDTTVNPRGPQRGGARRPDGFLRLRPGRPVPFRR